MDGKALAAELRQDLCGQVLKLKAVFPGLRPHLTVIQVGKRPDSTVYVEQKKKAAQEIGVSFTHERYPASISGSELLSRIQALNADAGVHGLLVQLPLPAHIDPTRAMEAISPPKDVDGFHPINMGRLAKQKGRPFHIACTAKGCLALLKRAGVQIEGKRAVVVGRSDIVGMPVFCLLAKAHATVTLCHSRTKNLKEIVQTADILVVAVGHPGLVCGSWVKSGCAVVDVGMNSVEDDTRPSGRAWVGDVDAASVAEVAGHLTPVPGGVGPMTVAMLMENTVEAARRVAEGRPI